MVEHHTYQHPHPPPLNSYSFRHYAKLMIIGEGWKVDWRTAPSCSFPSSPWPSFTTCAWLPLLHKSTCLSGSPLLVNNTSAFSFATWHLDHWNKRHQSSPDSHLTMGVEMADASLFAWPLIWNQSAMKVPSQELDVSDSAAFSVAGAHKPSIMIRWRFDEVPSTAWSSHS